MKNNEKFVYLEIKPGFQSHRDEIVERLLNASKDSKLVFEQEINRNTKFNKFFYTHLKGKSFFDYLDSYMNGNEKNPYKNKVMAGPSISLVFKGSEKIIDDFRKEQGDTKNPEKGTIRYDMGIHDENGILRPDVTMNVLHCSDSFYNAGREITVACICPKEFGITPQTKMDGNVWKMLDKTSEMRDFATDEYLYKGGVFELNRAFEILKDSDGMEQN